MVVPALKVKDGVSSGEGLSLPPHSAVCPPSMNRHVPVMYDASVTAWNLRIAAFLYRCPPWHSRYGAPRLPQAP